MCHSFWSYSFVLCGPFSFLPTRVSEFTRSLSRVRLFATPWTVAHQALPSMGFSRQGYWSGLPFPSPGELPYPGIEPRSPALHAGTLPSEPPGRANPHPLAQVSPPLESLPPLMKGYLFSILPKLAVGYLCHLLVPLLRLCVCFYH